MSPETVSATLEALSLRGYATHVVPMPGGRVSTPAGELDAAQLQIDERYRFDGTLFPDEERMVLAVRWTAADGQELWGVMTLGCGVDASVKDADVLRRVLAGPSRYATIADLEHLRQDVHQRLLAAGKGLDDGWAALEQKWNEAVPRLKAAASLSANNLETATTDLLVELEQGYLRLRDALTATPEP